MTLYHIKTAMERSRAKSASPLSQLRGAASMLIRSPLSSDTPSNPRLISNSTGDFDVSKQASIANIGSTSEGSSANSSRYSLKSQPTLSLRPRITSRSAEPTDRRIYRDMSPNSTVKSTFPQVSFLVRSRSSYSINFCAYAAMDRRILGSSASSLAAEASKNSLGTNASEDMRFRKCTEETSAASLPTRPTLDNLLLLEDGFLRDIEIKGFLGIWNHVATRLYFLMFLIWRGQENLYVDLFTDFRSFGWKY